jgi:hypothetical protein
MQNILRCLKVGLATLALALVSTPAFAQGGGATSAIAGVVLDSSGGVIPGATVTATNQATSGAFTAVTASNGTFNIPALSVGKYTVTVTLQGFKTAVLKDIDVSAGAAGEIRVTLEVGGLSETVTVETAAEVVRTQSAAIASTINTKAIQSLPLQRDLLNGGLVNFLPGVMTSSGGTRDSIVNGLPQSSINITLDGVSIQDNYLKTTDGFFARVSPRLDAIEEVSVTTAASGTDASGMGATQIKFTTRSGSNQFNGSGYFYFQHADLNTNTYFRKVTNQGKNEATLYQPGMRVGGPVVLPGLFDGHGKLFFFVNYEESRSPRTGSRTTTFMNDQAMAGNFSYLTANGVVVTRNVYDLANSTAARALTGWNAAWASPDPRIQSLLAEMRASVYDYAGGTFENITDNYNNFRLLWSDPTSGITHYPTIRMDYNLAPGHVLSGSWNYTDLNSRPDTTNTQQRTYPGFPIQGAQISDRYTFQTSLRSTLGGNIVNEFRYGMSGGATQFSPDKTTDMWANQGGYGLGMGGLGISNAGSGTTTSAREASTKFIENNLTWLRGAHNFTMGGQYTLADVWLGNYSRVPGIGFGIATGDPMSGLFNTTNFPNSSNGQRTAAQNFYATLTGRVNSITGTPRLDPNTLQYVYLGDSLQQGRLPEVDLYIQDAWRARSNLTVNVGVRYVIQMPFRALNGSYSTATLEDVWGRSGLIPGCDPSDPTAATCNFFKAGEMPGIVPTYQNLGEGVDAYKTDWDNIAPSIGVNWTPTSNSKWLRSILGLTGDSSISGGWSRSYERHGMSDFTGPFGSNPGITAIGDRTSNNGNLGAPPILFRSSDLGPPPTCSGSAVPPACIPAGPSYPIPANTTGSINMFDPGLQVPYSDSWTIGFQRALGRSSAIEVRYVGTRNRQQWTTYNLNEVNIHENGFLNEFRNAQANLYAHINSPGGCVIGETCSFAYRGPGTGTVPLPFYLGYLVGSTNSGSSGAYTGTEWTNSTHVNPLSQYNPNAFTAAGALNGNATFRGRAITAGIARNFFVANPDALGGANITGFGGYSDFDGFQVQFRRRLSAGLQFDASYATGSAFESVRYSFRVPRVSLRNTGGEGDVAHAGKTTFVYQLPFGQGRRFGSNVGTGMDRLIGGWQVSGTGRVQTGELIDLGNIRINGMTDDEVRNAFKMRKVGPNEIYFWPDDIIDNSIKAYSRDHNGYTLGAPQGRHFAPANGPDCMETIANAYGDCGRQSFIIQGPVFWTFDLNVVKQVPLSGRQSLEFRIDAFNLFDATMFDPETGIGSTTRDGFRTDGTLQSGRVVQLVARFSF